MSNTITPTVFYRTLNVEGLEIFYREAGPPEMQTLALRACGPQKLHPAVFNALLCYIGSPGYRCGSQSWGYNMLAAPRNRTGVDQAASSLFPPIERTSL
jgi:hypothetical protein